MAIFLKSYFIFSFSINLPIAFVMFVCLKTHFLQMKSALLPDQRGVPAEWPYKERRPPPPIPRKRTVVQFSLCNQISGKKTTSGDWQPTTGFMAVVSGGRRVSRTNEQCRDFTLPSCALTHTALPPSPLALTHFYRCLCLQPRRHRQPTRPDSCM